MSVVAGVSNTALLAIVNGAAEHIKDGRPQLTSVALFVVILLAYIYSQRYVLLTTSAEVERMVHHHRERLIGQLNKCELQAVEHIGRGPIFAAISSDTHSISQTANGLVIGAQSGILLVFAGIYLAMISLTSLVICATTMTVTAGVYLYKMQRVNAEIHAATDEENKLHDLLSGMLDGFKEVKLSSQRAAAVLADFVLVSYRTATCHIVAQQDFGRNLIFVQAAFLLQLGMLVFVTPLLGSAYSGTVMASMATVIFIFGPISGLVAAVPQVAIANAAAENLYQLEQLLEASIRENKGGATESAPPVSTVLEILALQRVFYSYVVEGGRFDVGPINLSIRAGETVFITGGNGSGKSTLIKLLTGLYSPISGELLVNDVLVSSDNAQAFRDRFCAVFSDFHLFRKLYGIPVPEVGVADNWLEEMEIASKTRIVGEGFSTIDLSAGQRKRVALIAAMLENKPIVILDEWAADQDPHFRRKFYEELLPRMKAEGKTVIAVTHDDRYFQLADRRLHMEDGQLYDLAVT